MRPNRFLFESAYGHQTQVAFVAPAAAEDVVDVAPGGDEFARVVAVDPLRPGEPVAVHLPVEAEEVGVAPGPRFGGELADVGVVFPGDHV